ncbi:MAG: chemotaxis response regulator protein-glutamate methylesterase [Spirochaetaceae bacterium]|nr:chemotaxis response regulator protein-glutamate methylesterase [Spirochaetaceae bacterium]
MEPISVLIVDDSALMRNLIRRMLDADENIEVVGTAMNGMFALRKTVTLNPDVIVLDLDMPELDGLGFLEKRKENNWDVPVVILSAVAKKGAAVTMKALALGASDFVTKPSGGSPESNRETAGQLIGMVKGYGGTYQRSKEQTAYRKDISKPVPVLPIAKAAPPTAPRPTREKQRIADWPELKPDRQPAPPQIIAIGISTGGPNALRKVFAEISENLKVPIVVVQHMPAGFTKEFANSLDKICPLEVKEAEEGDLIKPGRILIAPGDKHLKVEKKRLAAVAHVVDGENVNGHKPSAGVLYNSVAEQYGNAALAIIMTGMGRDGSREIGGVFKEGSFTLAQDEESSVVFGMPRVAIEHDYITQVVSLNGMAAAINRLAGV